MNEIERNEWKITDDGAAEWALEKIKEAEQERDRLIDLAELKVCEIIERERKIREQCDSETAFLRGKLAEYFATVPHKSTKTTESYKLLTGTLKIKKGGAVMKPDEERLTEYLFQHFPEYVKVVQKPAWGEYKKRLTITDAGVVDTATGEVVDCIAIEQKPDEFIVEV